LPTFPLSANNVNYVDASNTTKNLQTYLKSVGSQVNSIPTHLENISIDFYKQINFTTQLNSISSMFNNKIGNLEKLISSLSTFPLSSNDMNYIDISNATKNLETHLKSVDIQLNDIPILLSNIKLDYNDKISNIKSLY
jgi:septation ring formation regulator EzrA